MIKTIMMTVAVVLAFSLPAIAAEKQTDDPSQVVAIYLLAMKNGNMSHSLPIYSRATQKMLAAHPSNNPSAGQQLFNAYLSCTEDKTQDMNGFAVVRYRLQDRKCAPFFLIFEDNAWRLDMTMMQNAIRFNQLNEWRFVLSAPNPYTFAFQDWQFDRSGAPYAVRPPKQ